MRSFLLYASLVLMVVFLGYSIVCDDIILRKFLASISIIMGLLLIKESGIQEQN